MERTDQNAHNIHSHVGMEVDQEAAKVLTRYQQLKSLPRIAAPQFALKAAQGGIARLGDLLGRPVILTFFTASGWVSRAQMRALNEVAGYQMANVLGIAADSRDRLSGFAAEKRVRFLLLSDPGGVVAQNYGIASPPATFCIDRQGRIAASQRGLVPTTTLIEWLAWL